MPGSRTDIESLRARIAQIEQRPPLAATHAVAGDEALSMPPGLLHEVFTDAGRDAGAALGFALAEARGLIADIRQALILVQIAGDTQELGLPYGPGLANFGIDPGSVVLVQVQNITELLWAIEESIACRAVAAVIADVAGHPKALDFTASRRLSLRAASAGSSVFLMRYGSEREASAAQLRWHVVPELSSAPPFDARAPGPPRWRITIEKGRLAGRREGETLLVDWTENGFVLAGIGEAAGAPEPRAPLSGAASAALGHGLSQAG